MTTATDDPTSQAGWEGLPSEVRNRIFESLEQRTQRILDQMGPKLTYAEPQNCALHLLQQPHDITPSVTVILGLSLCPRCAVRASLEVAEHGLSQAELIRRALAGSWL